MGADSITTLTTTLVENVNGIDFAPLYTVMVSLIPCVLGVAVTLKGIRYGVNFVMSTIFSF